MPVKLSTIVNNIDKSVLNQTNADLIRDFYQFVKDNGTSESYQKNNLKAIINFASFIGSEVSFYDIQRKEQLIAFLDSKIKTIEQDPDKKWITTWNDYLSRIKYFLRWL